MAINYDASKFVKAFYAGLCRAIEEGYTLQGISDLLRNLLNNYRDLSSSDKSLLYSECMTVARATKSRVKDGTWKERVGNIKMFIRIDVVSRKVKANAEIRKKRINTYMSLRAGTIFFMCSQHSNPACGHKELQGQIFVDRFWRTKVAGDQFVAVQSYIRNHKCMTVQKAMREPYYLLTRPYCKHYLIPLDTATVLTTSQGRLRHQLGKDYQFEWHSYSDTAALRKDTFTAVNQYVPCKEFKRLARK